MKDKKNIFTSIGNWILRVVGFLASPRSGHRVNRQVLVTAYFVSFLFVAMVIYIGYYVAVPGKKDINSSYNPRQDLFADRIIKGEIISSDDKVLARSFTSSGGKTKRVYPFGATFAHVVGYDTNGKAGLEKSANFYLYADHTNPLKGLILDLENKKSEGDNVYSTLDSAVQAAADAALGSRRGAVVAMDPKTGKILCMVSHPDFDPNEVQALWDSLKDSEDSKLLNRAAQGLYPPGSTFKIITALEAIKEGKDKDFTYDCTGSTTVNSVKIKCAGYEAHGRLDLTSAMALSCNCAFVTLAQDFSIKGFRSTAGDFYYNKNLPLDFDTSKSRFGLKASSGPSDLPQTAIGQGDTLVTPLLNCMMVSAVANEGEMMKPYLVDHLESSDGKMVKKFTPSVLGEPMTEKEAGEIAGMLRAAVVSGTASGLSGLEHKFAGKTGTAEHDDDSGEPHAWFVGYGPVEDPEIAVSVIVEDGGSGSRTAVPVASQVFSAFFDR